MNDELYPKRNILSIDLKSFFASCECVERNLDPFSVPLVVANPHQGGGAITLAVTPYLKKRGVPSRGRIYQIPKNIEYMIVPPRMSLYIEYSKKVVSIYLDYVSKEDLHVYSIDECFLDVTDYLKLYKKTDYELALEILNKIKEKTGLTATCGIGPNILLAKVAMDIEAKKCKDGIAKWTYDDVKYKLWKIEPLSKMWGIGPRMEKRLNNLGIRNIYQLAHYDKNKIKNKFGVMGLELWEHANGIDLSVISELSKIPHEDKSYSNSQVLFKDYYGDNVKIIIREMVDVVTRRLRQHNKQGSVIGLSIGFSKNYGGGFHHVSKLDTPTCDKNIVYDVCQFLFDKYYREQPIRLVGVSIGGLVDDDSIQLDLFSSYEEEKKKKAEDKTVDYITNKFGKNSLLKASSLLEDSTIKVRNGKIGGHSA